MKSLFVSVFFWLSSPSVAEAGEGCCGQVTLGEKVLPLKSVSAVWIQGKDEVEVSFFSFEMTDEDQATSRQKGASFVARDQPSPAPEHWPTWCPYAVVSLKMLPGSEVLSKSPESLVLASVNFGQIEKPNHTWFSSGAPETLPEDARVEGRVKEGERITLHLSGVITNDGKKLTYDLRGSAPLRVCEAPRCG